MKEGPRIVIDRPPDRHGLDRQVATAVCFTSNLNSRVGLRNAFLQLNRKFAPDRLPYSPKEDISMARSRSMFTAQEKAAVVKRYLVDKTPVSDLCDEFGLQPTQVYQWQRELFENAEAAFTRPSRKRKADDRKDKKIEALEARSCKKRSRR